MTATEVIALFALLVACSAMIAAWRSPKAAATFADEMRKKSQETEAKHQLRMGIFVSLMKCRRQMLHSDAITALNLIDVAFVDDAPVRDAYRSFMDAALEEPHNPTKIVERYHVIIERVAAKLGYGDKITSFDVRSGYYPNALSKLDEAALAEAEEKIARRMIAQQVPRNPFA